MHICSDVYAHYFGVTIHYVGLSFGWCWGEAIAHNSSRWPGVWSLYHYRQGSWVHWTVLPRHWYLSCNCGTMLVHCECVNSSVYRCITVCKHKQIYLNCLDTCNLSTTHLPLSLFLPSFHSSLFVTALVDFNTHRWLLMRILFWMSTHNIQTLSSVLAFLVIIETIWLA